MSAPLSLEDELARAEADLLRADFTDSTAKMLREKASARQRIADFKRRIAVRDSTYLENAVASLGDRHAG